MSQSVSPILKRQTIETNLLQDETNSSTSTPRFNSREKDERRRFRTEMEENEKQFPDIVENEKIMFMQTFGKGDELMIEARKRSAEKQISKERRKPQQLFCLENQDKLANSSKSFDLQIQFRREASRQNDSCNFSQSNTATGSKKGQRRIRLSPQAFNDAISRDIPGIALPKTKVVSRGSVNSSAERKDDQIRKHSSSQHQSDFRGSLIADDGSNRRISTEGLTSEESFRPRMMSQHNLPFPSSLSQFNCLSQSFLQNSTLKRQIKISTANHLSQISRIPSPLKFQNCPIPIGAREPLAQIQETFMKQVYSQEGFQKQIPENIKPILFSKDEWIKAQDVKIDSNQISENSIHSRFPQSSDCIMRKEKVNEKVQINSFSKQFSVSQHQTPQRGSQMIPKTYSQEDIQSNKKDPKLRQSEMYSKIPQQLDYSSASKKYHSLPKKNQISFPTLTESTTAPEMDQVDNKIINNNNNNYQNNNKHSWNPSYHNPSPSLHSFENLIHSENGMPLFESQYLQNEQNPSHYCLPLAAHNKKQSLILEDQSENFVVKINHQNINNNGNSQGYYSLNKRSDTQTSKSSKISTPQSTQASGVSHSSFTNDPCMQLQKAQSQIQATQIFKAAKPIKSSPSLTCLGGPQKVIKKCKLIQQSIENLNTSASMTPSNVPSKVISGSENSISTQLTHLQKAQLRLASKKAKGQISSISIHKNGDYKTEC